MMTNTDAQIDAANFIIRELGGLTKTARTLGHPITTVQGWKERGKVPQEHWISIIEKARKVGKKFKVEDFLRVHTVSEEVQ